MSIYTGIKGAQTAKVTEENTAKALKSGALDVFATPAMIALMEYTASTSIEPYIEEGQSTVGTLININHTSATPLGMTVSCKSTLTLIDGKRLVFEVIANDEKGQIGKGTHERFIIDKEKFLKKTYSKIEG